MEILQLDTKTLSIVKEVCLGIANPLFIMSDGVIRKILSLLQIQLLVLLLTLEVVTILENQ